MTNIEKVSKIISSIKGKNIEDRRIAALREAGFKVSFEGVKYNWGQSGTVRQDGDDALAQLHCAKGGRAKNGYSFNRCEIYRVQG